MRAIQICLKDPVRQLCHQRFIRSTSNIQYTHWVQYVSESRPKAEGIKCSGVKEPFYSMGVVELKTPGGHSVKSYNAEKTEQASLVWYLCYMHYFGCILMILGQKNELRHMSVKHQGWIFF